MKMEFEFEYEYDVTLSTPGCRIQLGDYLLYDGEIAKKIEVDIDPGNYAEVNDYLVDYYDKLDITPREEEKELNPGFYVFASKLLNYYLLQINCFNHSSLSTIKLTKIICDDYFSNSKTELIIDSDFLSYYKMMKSYYIMFKNDTIFSIGSGIILTSINAKSLINRGDPSSTFPRVSITNSKYPYPRDMHKDINNYFNSDLRSKFYENETLFSKLDNYVIFNFQNLLINTMYDTVILVRKQNK